jgi:hypothetical protein
VSENQSNLAVYTAINEITAELAVEGISKDRVNQAQHYQFRGVDDVYEALAGKLAAHKLCILPRVLKRESVEKTMKSGAVMFYTFVDVAFDFVSAIDGSHHTVVMAGEASDSGDKSCKKALSAAYSYMCFETFCIPTEGENDSENEKPGEGQAAAIPAPMVPTTIKTDTEVHERLRKVLAAYCGDDENAKKELLVKITSYTKEGAFHAGEDSVDKINDHLAAYAIRKFEEMNAPKKEPVTKQQLLDWLATDTSECLKPKHYVIENLEQIASQADKKEIMSALVKRRRELSAKK